MGQPLKLSDAFEGLYAIQLKIFGFWYVMNDYRTTDKKSILFKIQVAVTILFAVPYVLFQFIHVFVADVSLEVISSAGLICAPSIQLVCKLLFLYYRIKEVCTIYDTLRVDFLLSIPEKKRLRTRNIYKQAARMSNFMCLMLALTLSSPWYEVVFCYESILVLWNGGIYYSYQCVIIMPLVCLSGHFDALCHHIETLRKEDISYKEGPTGTAEGNDFMNEELKYIFEDYEKLLRHGTLLKEMYNPLISVLLVLEIASSLGAALHLILGNQDPILMTQTGGFLAFQLYILALICGSSSMLETASGNVHEALYFNEWCLVDKKFAKTQQMMMTRASRPLSLTAFKMYPINQETLLSILQFIYSTAAVFSKTK